MPFAVLYARCTAIYSACRAEAQVPLALAKALNDGNIGAFDYYKLQNLLGDTEMRENLGRLTKGDIRGVIGTAPPPVN